jgi:hypothetical protein
MSELIRIYFDGVQVDAPNGKVSVILERDKEIRGLIKSFSLELTYFGTAYDALLTAFNTNNIMDSIDVRVEKNVNGYFQVYYTGIIYVNEIEFDLSKKTATATIQDGTFYGLINNNKRIKAFLNATKTKNGEALSAVTLRDIDFFTPSTGAYSTTDRDCVTINDAFDYLINFMSDNAVSYSSTYFSSGDGRGIVLCNGSAIRNNTNVNLNLSFYDLFREADKLFNISFRIDSPYTSPQMVIERTQDLYSNLVSITLEGVNGLKMSFDKDKFYGIIKVGSKTTQDDDAGSFSYPDGLFYGVKDEEYHVLGNSNIDTSLDLVNDFVIDSNVIEDIIVNTNDGYDEDIFVVETNYPTADADAVQYDNFFPGSTPVVYNFGLNNQSKTERWLGSVPNDIAAYLSTGDNTFEATKTSTQSIIAGTNTILFDNEVSDPGTNYNPLTGKFTAPADGAFSFETNMPVVVPNATGATTAYYLRQYDASNVLIREVNFGNIEVPDDFDNDTILSNYFGSATFYLSSTDYVVVELDVAGGSTVTGSGNFSSGGNSIDGGVFQFYDPTEYRAIVLSFDYPLTKSQYDTIFENPQKRIKITHFGETYYGWIKRLEWDIVKGLAQIELDAMFSVLN